MNSYKTVKGVFSNTTVIERSKFICYVKGVADENEAKEFVAEIRKLNSLANHNCYAYIADENGLIEKFSDDGEPQGTAGRPMLEVLRNCGFKKTVAVVTRYFGGVKLGTGGLVRAYGGAVSECLKKAAVMDMKMSVFLSVKTDYEGYNAILRLQKNKTFSGCDTEYGGDIVLKIATPAEYSDAALKGLADCTVGRAEITVLKEDYFDFGGSCR